MRPRVHPRFRFRSIISVAGVELADAPAGPLRRIGVGRTSLRPALVGPSRYYFQVRRRGRSCLIARTVSRATLSCRSQDTLGKMVGTTRSRVNVLMRKFQQLGFIGDKDGLTVDNSLLSVIL